MPSDTDRARVLVAVLVYNGRNFVPRCLESVQRLEKGSCDVDVLILDDHSPEEGWSSELAALADGFGIPYYCSPRNLGIPRNFNMGILRALSADYDDVVLLNSDVVVPYNLVDGLVATAEGTGRVGSVTAWSNNCSIYRLPNDDPERFLSGQEDVEWVSEVLGAGGWPAIDIPVGVGFCLLIPTAAAREVGLFDPVFGRGYCEENDWCLRAKAAGFRNLLATNVFVYHMGGASTSDAGLVAPGETTVSAHERIIDWRYPTYRTDVAEFERSGVMQRLATEGLRRIVLSAASQWGYEFRLTSLPGPPADEGRVSFSLAAESHGHAVSGYFKGFTAHFELDPLCSVIDNLTGLIGRPPNETVINGHSPEAQRLAEEVARAGLPVVLRNPYPERI